MSDHQIWGTMSPDLVEALDIWIERHPEPRPSRLEAIETALRDWLISLGLLPFHDEPEALS